MTSKTAVAIAALAACLVAFGAIGSQAILRTAEQTAECGAILVRADEWLGGAGVDVHSNGQYQGTGTSCANDDREVYNLGASPPVYGFAWQCVELVNRLYATKGWSPKLVIGPEHSYGAKGLYPEAGRGRYAGLAAKPNGSGYQPVPGDLIVHGNGTWGHVAVVDRIEGSVLHAVEQNSSASGRATYEYDASIGRVSRAGATVLGYVHAELNTGNSNDHSPAAGGDSHVSRDGDNLVALRNCDHWTPDNAVTDGCGVLDRLPDDTAVTLRCSRNTVAPPGPGYQSPRWFYITQSHGAPHPGWSGWVYAELVRDPTIVPDCTDQILHAYALPDVEPLVFTITADCSTAGDTATANASGFTPGGEFTISVAHAQGNWMADEQRGTIAPDGSIGWQFHCAVTEAAGIAFDYEVRAEDHATNRWVDTTFEVKPSPASSTSTTAPPPAGEPTGPTPPHERTVAVYNKVTNGATQMREDTPAYLSTVTQNYCRTNGCILPGTEVSTGAQLLAYCQTTGDRTTNGQDGSTIDDTNPGLYTSHLWYGIKWTDARTGYISEVWLHPDARGGLALPSC